MKKLSDLIFETENLKKYSYDVQVNLNGTVEAMSETEAYHEIDTIVDTMTGNAAITEVMLREGMVVPTLINNQVTRLEEANKIQENSEITQEDTEKSQEKINSTIHAIEDFIKKSLDGLTPYEIAYVKGHIHTNIRKY